MKTKKVLIEVPENIAASSIYFYSEEARDFEHVQTARILDQAAPLAVSDELRAAAKEFYNLTIADPAVLLRAASFDQRDSIVQAGIRLKSALLATPPEPAPIADSDPISCEQFNAENGPMRFGEPVLPGKPKYRESVEDENGYFLYGDLAIAYLRKKLEALQSQPVAMVEPIAMQTLQDVYRLGFQRCAAYPNSSVYAGSLTYRADMAKDLTPYSAQPLPAPTQQAVVPDGWKLVPTEPTLSMSQAATASCKDGTYFTMERIYRAMIGAAPTQAERSDNGLAQ